jgi:hypothetical protein
MTKLPDVATVDPVTAARPTSPLAIYVGFGVLALVIAVTTFIHLIFWSFSGEVVSLDAVLAVIVIAVYAIGLIGTIWLRRNVPASVRWGRISLAVTGVLLVADVIRFIVYFSLP